jgi:hypothetical protein
MTTIFRRIRKALGITILAFAGLQTVSATAQAPPATDSVSGTMLFAMHVQFASALKAQGFTYSFLGYTAPTPNWLGGFPILGGSMNEITGYGEALCGGDLQFVNGSLTMDIRNMQFLNTPAGESLTAQIYLNGVSQGRRTIFTSAYNEIWGITVGMTLSPNSYLSFDPAFQSLFLTFFQVPQLASAFNVESIGFISFTLILQPITL